MTVAASAPCPWCQATTWCVHNPEPFYVVECPICRSEKWHACADGLGKVYRVNLVAEKMQSQNMAAQRGVAICETCKWPVDHVHHQECQRVPLPREAPPKVEDRMIAVLERIAEALERIERLK